MDVDENADDGNREASSVGVKRTQEGSAKARSSQDGDVETEVRLLSRSARKHAARAHAHRPVRQAVVPCWCQHPNQLVCRVSASCAYKDMSVLPCLYYREQYVRVVHGACCGGLASNPASSVSWASIGFPAAERCCYACLTSCCSLLVSPLEAALLKYL